MSTIVPDQSSRRQFLRLTGGTALAALAFPTIIPSSALGADGAVAPSNRLTIGCIGNGPQGLGDMGGFLAQKDAQVVAVCDCKKEQLDIARERVNAKYQNQDCKAYEDFQEVIARKDIDACLVATPDHWHVLITVAAIKSGKPVYMEKPMSCSVAENQALRDAVHKYNKVFQFGTQQRSDRKFRLACELVRSGMIGKLKHINVWCPGSSPGGSTTEVAVPATLNYERWLGPAPFKPHTEDRCSADGRKKTWWFIRDYSYGFITGWGIHPMDIAMWGGGDALLGEVEIEGKANYPKEGACNTATVWEIGMKFGSGVTLTFVGVPNGGNSGAATGEPWYHQAEWTARYGKLNSHGTVFEGSDGWVYVDRAKIITSPENLSTLNEDTLKVKLKASKNHVRDFLDSIQQNQLAVAHVDEAFKSDSICQVADIAAQLQRKLTFDFKTEKFFNDKEANRHLELRDMRKPWKLKV
jgi:predicted dehydrogenase